MTTNFAIGKATRTKYVQLVLAFFTVGISVGVTYWLQELRYEKQIQVTEKSSLIFDLRHTKAELRKLQESEKQKTDLLRDAQQEAKEFKQESEELKKQSSSVQAELKELKKYIDQMELDLGFFKTCIFELKTPVGNLQGVLNDFGEARPKYNPLGKALVSVYSVNSLHQAWNSSNCRRAKSISENQATYNSLPSLPSPNRNVQSVSPEQLLISYTQSLTNRDFSRLAEIYPKGRKEEQQSWLQGENRKAPIISIQVVNQPRKILTSSDGAEIVLRATLQYCRQDGNGSIDTKNYTFVQNQGTWKLDSVTRPKPEDIVTIRC